MTPVLREAVRTGLVLFGFAIVGTSLLVLAQSQTRPIIAASEERAKLALIQSVMPAERADNNLIADAVSLPASPALGSTQPTLAYPARKGGAPVGAVLEVVAPDGYSGRIALLVGVLEDGSVAGVRVVTHRETPGLGDYIDAARSPWVEAFTGKSLGKPPAARWAVKKDGGDFDYMAGATISPRAVVKAVRKALEYYGQNRERIFAAPVPAAGGKA